MRSRVTPLSNHASRIRSVAKILVILTSGSSTKMLDRGSVLQDTNGVEVSILRTTASCILAGELRFLINEILYKLEFDNLSNTKEYTNIKNQSMRHMHEEYT